MLSWTLPPCPELILYPVPSSFRGSNRPEGAGLLKGSCRAEFCEIRCPPNVRPRPLVRGVLVWISGSFHNARGEGKHDGAEPAEQPGDNGGPLLHQPAQPHDRPGPLQPALRWPHGRWWAVWIQLHGESGLIFSDINMFRQNSKDFHPE